MSLITEALGLRRSKSAARTAQETLPPFRTRNLSMQVVAMLVMIAGLTVLAVWQGPMLLAWLENLTGVGGAAVTGKPKPATAQKTPVTAPPSIPDPIAEKTSTSPAQAGPPASAQTVASTPQKTGATVAQKAGATEKASLLTETRAEASGDAAFLPVEVAFLPVARDEDPAQAVERKKNELAAVVRGFQIQGVRLQGNESRALINGNPVAVGESVGDEGLKLKTVEGSRLIFSDALGNEYPRSY